LYVDAEKFTPTWGISTAPVDMRVFQFFVEWHLEQNPCGRGGLYHSGASNISVLETLIHTRDNITTILGWLHQKNLITADDVQEHFLIHSAAHLSSISTLRFLLDLCPRGVLLEDIDGYLPIHLCIRLRCRSADIFKDEDFEILQLLISRGISSGEINTVGGLFHRIPGGGKSCTLRILLEKAREDNAKKVWKLVKTCLAQAGDYSNAPITHAAVRNRKYVAKDLLQEILGRFGAANRDGNGELPLQYAVRVGMAWDEGIEYILEANREALDVGVFPYAATSKQADFSTLYHLVTQPHANNFGMFMRQQ